MRLPQASRCRRRRLLLKCSAEPPGPGAAGPTAGARRAAQVMLKAAEGTSAADRARVATLALACVCLAQGVAFFHAGDEILRSKSLDRDSYNSGAPGRRAAAMLAACGQADTHRLASMTRTAEARTRG
jgi:dihydrodipicolinate reductase